MSSPTQAGKHFGIAISISIAFLWTCAGNIGTAAASSATPASATTVAQTVIVNALFSSLNAERRYDHLPALRFNADLVRSAHAHNLAMAKFNTMSHQLPGEAYFATRITNAGYRWRFAGENIAWSTDRTTRGALSLERQMYNEKAPDDAHRLNILSRTFVDVGIDIVLDVRTHKMWLTEDFGRHA